MTVYFSPEAEADFAAVVGYLVERNPVAASELSDRIFNLIDSWFVASCRSSSYAAPITPIGACDSRWIQVEPRSGQIPRASSRAHLRQSVGGPTSGNRSAIADESATKIEPNWPDERTAAPATVMWRATRSSSITPRRSPNRSCRC